MKSKSSIMLTYFDDFIVNQTLVLRNNSVKDSIVTANVMTKNILELKYSLVNGLTRKQYFHVLYIQSGDVINLKVNNLNIEQLDDTSLLLNNHLDLSDTPFYLLEMQGDTQEKSNQNKKTLNQNLNKINLMKGENKLNDSIANLWKLASLNSYYVKQTRLNFKNEDPYLDTLAKELSLHLNNQNNINSTFISSSIYFLTFYQRIKDGKNYDIATSISNLAQLTIKQNYKQGIAYQVLSIFTDKNSPTYYKAFNIFNTKINDSLFVKQHYYSNLLPKKTKIELEQIAIYSADQKILTFGQILKQNKGKIIILDFWASWCIPCIEEFQYIEKHKETFKNKNVVFVGISMDKDSKKSDWLRILNYKKISLKNHYRVKDSSNKSLSAIYKIEAIPRYLIFDKNGNLINDSSIKPSDTEFEKQIKSYL